MPRLTITERQLVALEHFLRGAAQMGASIGPDDPTALSVEETHDLWRRLHDAVDPITLGAVEVATA